MKILVISNGSNGIYRFRKMLLEKLIKENIEVEIITRDSGDIEKLKKIGCRINIIEIDRRGMNLVKEIQLLIGYYKKIKEISPDKIVSYTIKPNIYGGFVSRMLKKEFYPNITGLGTAFQNEGVLKKAICLAYRISFKKAKKVFFENKHNNEIFIKEGICNEENSVVLNGAGVNLEEFKLEPLPSFESINFIFMGRVMKEKGIEELFYAIKKIKKKYSNVNFMILGLLEENYKEQLENMEKEGLLKYYGVQKDVKKYIKRAHCCILPSHHEGMSNTLLECGAMGRALITSDISGCKEAVISTESGFLHEVKNGESLSAKINEYLKLDNEQKSKMGKKSREYIVKVFDKKKVVLKTSREICEK